jgi:hypothetical protein
MSKGWLSLLFVLPARAGLVLAVASAQQSPPPDGICAGSRGDRAAGDDRAGRAARLEPA